MSSVEEARIQSMVKMLKEMPIFVNWTIASIERLMYSFKIQNYRHG
jgi:hypothetical protein